MKIKSVTASNILSFPFVEDIEHNSFETIVFDSHANILIGPNGSGKSNLIEIISKVLQSYFTREFQLDENSMSLINENQKPIRFEGNRRQGAFKNLVKHRDYQEESSTLKLTLYFDNDDVLNLNFVLLNFEELHKISQEYSHDSKFFRQRKFEITSFENSFDINFSFKINNKTKDVTIEIEREILSDKEKFIHDYLESFNLLQKLIEIAITTKEKPWKELKTTFALIGSLRQHDGFVNQIQIGPGLGQQLNNISQDLTTQSTKNAVSTNTVFQIAFMKIGQYIKLNRDKYGKPVNDLLEELQTKEGSLIRRINDALAEIDLKVKLDSFEPYSLTIPISIRNINDKLVAFDELSTGQKSIFYLIFSVYGFDLENGFLVIDEPELHLHTSMQKKYFQILKEITKPFNLQIILATHSPVFIDESTIQNTFRFSKTANDSIITRPNNAIGRSQKDLLQFLTYTNSSRIFFSDIVVLVEGNSDEYFFKYFYENYYLTKRKTKQTIEFLGIGGKKQSQKWMDFLNLFKISNAFIGDFDNIKDTGVSDSAGVDYEKLLLDTKQDAISRVNQQISASGTSSKDGISLLQSLDQLIQKDFIVTNDEKKELRELWQYVLERCGVSSGALFRYLSLTENRGVFKKIKDEIIKKYSENIYILQMGDLEAYLGIRKDMNEVIDFCAKRFQEWVKDEEVKVGGDSKLNELMNIMDLIVKGEKTD